MRTGLPDYEIKNKDLISSSDKQIEAVCKCSEANNLSFIQQIKTKNGKIFHINVRKLNEADFTFIANNGEIWKYQVHIYDKKPFKIIEENESIVTEDGTEMKGETEREKQHRKNCTYYD